MLRRRVFAFVICIMFFMVSIPALAFSLPTWQDDQGRACVGVFQIAKHRDDAVNGNREVYDFWTEFCASSRSIVMCNIYDTGAYDYVFYIVPDGVTATLREIYSGTKVEIKFTSGGSLVNVPYAIFTDSIVTSDDNYYFNVFNSSASAFYTGVVSGRYFEKNPPSGLTSSVVAEYDGNVLGFIDDLSEQTTPPETPEKPDGILGWLNSFWEKLKSFFVPSAGYFDDWFEEIRSSAMVKLGSLSNLSDALNSSFEHMKNDTSNTGLKLVVPKDSFFKGFSGITVDLLASVSSVLNVIKGWLTAVCVIFTAIACYRRLIVLFEQ